jgi:hypothetical protein
VSAKAAHAGRLGLDHLTISAIVWQ